MKLFYIILIFIIVKLIYNYFKFRGISQIDYESFKKIEKEKELLILDVRTPQEFKTGHLIKAKNIPLSRLKTAIVKNKVSKESKIIVVCRSGMRSNKAALILHKSGYKNIYNLQGGIQKIKD
ncbi:Rhodanese-related sulfurtransferase [Desulfonispora thiosulfatigenes DSM 11270]|uniref:Rhodanese-related sulfurtransferase n=1 Tax=Desulfonispora thiosulfatigenes DSM 11270 TaxID=656914 RepID=A0A1W1VHL1_DESTI|nr:rhodanese-like domain-containing protein [Desulfonispora thiosulfatigenes]SMB92743.1 Rhodanese-related sulfurtransferase [Desulfonispora thiosulfatigenes DSM 11270]